MSCPSRTAGHHTVHRHQGHYGWSRDQPPAVQVAPDECVTLEIRDASDGVITPRSVAADLLRLDPERANPLTGPIAVAGARAGDRLLVELLEFELSGWGWTGIIPGFGLLADEFEEPYLLTTRHDARWVEFGPGIRLPVRPFTGTIGTARDRPGRLNAIPPHGGGGNMDMPQIGRGAVLTLPVAVPGGLLSLGDTHAAQGDGEVCGTAVESPMTVALRIGLVRGGAPLASPQLAYRRPPEDGGPVQACLGIGGDLMAAARDAVRRMIDYLQARHGLTAEMAYCLCSAAADLRISEIVNAPNWVVSLHLPLAIFD